MNLQRARRFPLLQQCMAGACLLLALASADLHAGSAATVIRSQNDVTASVKETTRALVRKDPVFAGETIRTARSAAVSMRFADGSIVSLDASTELTVGAYGYQEGGSASDNLLLELVSGSLRSATGAISKVNPRAYSVKTPMASLSIRGTFYMADVDLTTNQLSVFVWNGLVVVENEYGRISLGAGEGAVVNAGEKPVRSNAMNNLMNLTPVQLGSEFVSEIEEENRPGQESVEEREPEPEPEGQGLGRTGVTVGANPDDPEAPLLDADIDLPTEAEENEEEGSQEDPMVGADIGVDPTEEGLDDDIEGTVFAPGLDDEGREIGADRIIDNLP